MPILSTGGATRFPASWKPRFHNHVFDSLDALEKHREIALGDFAQDRSRIQSIVAWPWIIDARLN